MTAKMYSTNGDANASDSQKLTESSSLEVTLNVSSKLPSHPKRFVSLMNVFHIDLMWLGHIHIHICPPLHSSRVPPEAHPR